MVSLVNSFLALHLSIFSLRATILYPVTLASRSLSFLFCLLPFLVPGLPSFFLSLKISLHNLLGSVRSSFLVSSFVSFLLRVSFYDLPVVAYWFSVCLFLLSSHLFALYADRRSWWYLFCFLQEYLCGIFSLFLYPTCNLSIMVVRVSKNLMFVIFFWKLHFMVCLANVFLSQGFHHMVCLFRLLSSLCRSFPGHDSATVLQSPPHS